MKRVLFPMILFMATTFVQAHAQPNIGSAWTSLVTKTKVDLNGDGRAESIELKRVGVNSKNRNDGAFQLFINGTPHSISDGQNSIRQSGGFYIADIDRSDSFKEIVIRTPWGAFTKDIVFWFDGKQLRRSAVLNQPGRFNGDGTLVFVEWYGFWWRRDTFVLRANHTLRRAPKEFYKVDAKARITQSLPLYRRRTSQRSFVTLPAGRDIVVEKTDLKGWFQLRSQGGSRGWVSRDELLANTSIMILP